MPTTSLVNATTGLKANVLTLRKLVRATLERMNWHFGRGDLTSIEFDKDGVYGTVFIRVPVSQRSGVVEKKAFRLDGERVVFRGHRAKFTAGTDYRMAS